MKQKKINCFKCTHFYVTWDKNFPRGCRAMKFKSRELPSAVAFNASGMECQKFKKLKQR